jgi:hypothetical protein
MQKDKDARSQKTCCAIKTYDKTRASDHKPAIAKPKWLSILKSFFWYEASSDGERYLEDLSIYFV